MATDAPVGVEAEAGEMIKTVPASKLLNHVHPNAVAAAQSLPPAEFVYPERDKPSKVNTIMKASGIVAATCMIPGAPLMNSVIYHFLPKREKFTTYLTLPRPFVCWYTRSERFSKALRWAVVFASVLACTAIAEISKTIFGREAIDEQKTMCQEIFFDTEPDRDMTVQRLSAQFIPEHSNYWLLKERPMFTFLCTTLGPLTEEVFYRGMLFGHLLQGGAPFLASALYSSAIFSIPHVLQEVRRKSCPEYTRHMGVIIFGNGMVWATAYWLTGNVWVPFMSHALMNTKQLYNELEISFTRAK